MSAIPPVVSSPLGVDPVVAQNAPAATPTPAPVEPTPTPPVVAPKGKTIPDQEYENLMRKAGNYDLIERDPELIAKIGDHLRAKSGRLPPKPASTPAATQNMPEEDPRVKQLEEQVRTLTSNQARAEINAFKQQHPDLEEYKEDVTRLLKHGLSLDEAYRFSKAAKSQPSQTPVKATPAVPTTENNRNAGAVELTTTDDSFEVLEKRINDPKATPRMDDAIALAYQLAKSKQQAEG